MLIENYEEKTSWLERSESRLRAWRERAGLDPDYTLPQEAQAEVDQRNFEIWRDALGFETVEQYKAWSAQQPARQFADYEFRRK